MRISCWSVGVCSSDLCRVYLLEVDVRILLAEFVDLGHYLGRDFGLGRAVCSIRAQRDHRLAIKRCGLARLCIGVAHVRELVETDAPAIAQWKTEARQILRGLDRADRAQIGRAHV